MLHFNVLKREVLRQSQKILVFFWGGGTRAFPYSRFLGDVLNLIISINMIKVNYILFYKFKGDCEVYFITSNPLFNIFQSIIYIQIRHAH